MPIIKSAKKKLRQDKKRTAKNSAAKKNFRNIILAYKKKPTTASLSKVFSALDMVAKKHVIHPNKAARLKSRLSKLLGKKTASTKPTSTKARKPAAKSKTSSK